MCQIEKFGASPFRYVRTDIEVHGEERVLTVHNRAAIPIITKRFACYDTPSFYSPVRKEPRDKKQKNRKIQDKQGQAHDRAPKKRSQERESETKPKQKKRGDYRHSPVLPQHPGVLHDHLPEAGRKIRVRHKLRPQLGNKWFHKWYSFLVGSLQHKLPHPFLRVWQ